MSNLSLFEHMGVIFKIEGYFEHNDYQRKISLTMIDDNGKKIVLNGSTIEFESMFSQLMDYVEKQDEIKYLP